ncbi:RHS repeat protein [Zooshikella ganghwensis]|uniref:RHS repeat protein n=1 Tax=Zooshikella ganghwensis TaxID=202772 RepID=UPI000408FDF4|nr:RHS repeat protein [Zooshikella ganghwensis]
MVAVVSGYGLGLFNTTTVGLGNKAEFGQGKESIKINAVTGNLILQQKDDALISQGIDAHLLRTYNSQGLLNDANGDNFRFGFNQQLLGLTGEINQPNSTIQRISADGATTTYTYNTQQQCYISTDGSGAHDKLEYLGDNRWRWTEGSSLITETYHWQNNQGRLITRSDRQGFKIQLEYQHDKVVALRDEQGQALSIEYTGNNVSAIHHSSAGHSSVKTRYHYDQLNRLTSVIVDLTAEDNSITDNHVYKTQYQYDGDSRRIAHIKQSDGTALTINYQQGSDGQFRVSQITKGKGSQAVTTRYVYDLNARKTDIIQVNNATSGTGPTYSLWYDEQGRLTRTANPADAHGFRLEINYQYDNDDNLLTQTDNTGRILSYTYDQYGNRTTEIDAEQNKITRTFNSAQQKISETIYPKGNTQQGVSQYWVYDEKQRVSFHINAEGSLEAYQYQRWGDNQLQQTTTLTYLSAVVPVENFSPSSPPSNTTIKQWLAQQTSFGQIKRKDQYFDFRGQLHKVVQSQALNQSDLASTQPNASNILNTTYFIYDTYGQLIKSVDSRGQAPAENPTIPTNEIQLNKDNFETLFVYDGLGRLLASTNSLGETTRYQYQDQLQQVLKTAANGLQTTELYDSVGRIINRTQIDLNATAANNATLTHTFLYDKQSRKIAEQDPSGAISLTFYHRNGQPVATVDAMGYVTEYFYNKTGKQVAQRRYATALSVDTFAALQVRKNEGTLTGIKSNPFESIRPPLSENDRITRHVFSKNNQLRFSIDGEGAVTEHRYDQAGRKILTIQHAKTLNTPTDLNAQSDLALNITAVQQQLGETLTADDRVQRFFYSKSGQLSGILDAEGYLTRYGYTATGERSYISQLASRVLNPETDIHQWLTCSLSELQVTPSDKDQHALNFYNAQGWVIATVDAEGYLTFFAYDAVGNKTLERRLASHLTHTEQARLINWAQGKPGRFQAGSDLLLALVQQKQTEQDQLHSYKYDAANRLREETDAQGNTHRYQYNAAGQVIHTTQGIMLAQQYELLTQARTSQAEYDGFGRLIKTTDALGAETLIRYDSAGRKIQQQDAAGHITRFYYDQRGRLTHTINALGEVSAVIYNTFDQAISSRVYITRLTPEQLTQLEGGVITSAVATLFSQLAKDSDAIKRNRYNRRGQITEKIDAENNSQQLNYNAFGELNSITQTIRQSLGITQTQYLTYNRRGEKVTTSTSVLQGDALLPDITTHYTLDAFGRTTQTTNALGHTTTFEYDRLGRQLSITSPNQSTSHTSYDAFNRVLNTTDARGNTTAYQYQKTTTTNAEGVEFIAGHQVIVTTPTGLQKITEKNLQGENVRITAPDNTTSEFFYDKAGNLIKTVDALGQETTQQFNQLGWKTSVTQADGLKVHYEYDAVGRQLTHITDPDGLALKEQIQYDALGNKVQVTDANNTLTQHHYNRNGQLTKIVVDPEGLNLITAYEYDNAGNQIRIQQGDANGWQRVTEHRFNGYGQREATIIDPDGLKLTTRFYYDDAGQLIKKINAENHATQYVYDNVGRLRFTINPQGTVSETQYDNNDNKIAEINYKNAVDASLTYTEQKLTAALNSSAEDQWQGLIYDADNRLTFSIDGLGYLTKIDYNKNNQVIAKHIYKSAFAPFVKQTNLSVAYIESRINNDDSTRRITTERVIYDALGQTKFKADANGWLTEFQYDQAGRVIASKRYNVTWQQLELNNDTPINTINEKVSQWQHTAKPEDIHHESHWYDNAGRRLYTQDTAGYLTGYRFDALGQVVASFKYETPAPHLRQSRADINQITQHLSANSTIAKANYHVYDTAGRKRFTVNDLGYVTEYRYNALGESITTLRYPQPIAKEHAQNLTAIREGLKQTPIVVHGTQLHEKSRPILESGLSLVNGTYGQTWEAQEVGSVAATSNWVSKTIKPNQPYKLMALYGFLGGSI